MALTLFVALKGLDTPTPKSVKAIQGNRGQRELKIGIIQKLICGCRGTGNRTIFATCTESTEL